MIHQPRGWGLHRPGENILKPCVYFVQIVLYCFVQLFIGLDHNNNNDRLKSKVELKPANPFYQRSSSMNLFVLHSLPHCVSHLIKNILFSFLAPLLEAIFLSSFHLLKCPCFYLSVYLFPCSSLASHLGQFVFVFSNWKMMNNFLLFQFLAARCS